MTEPQEKPKLSAQEAKLDKFRTALSSLSEQVGDFSSIREAFYKDVKEELKLSKDQTDALWERVLTSDKLKEIKEKKALESIEKKDLDELVENVENYDVIKDAIEKASGDIGVLKGLLSSLEEKWNKSKFGKTIKWGALTAWFGKYFIEFANAGLKKLEEAKAQGSIFTGMWKSPIYNKIKDLGKWFSGVNKMEKQIKVAFKAGKYKQAKELVKKIQKIEPENKLAKDYTKKITDAKKTPRPTPPSDTATAAAAATAPAVGITIPEIKPKTDLDQLKDVFAAKHIPLASIGKTEYANFLKSRGLKPNEFIKTASEALKKDGAIGIINEVVKAHGNLQKTFKYKLEDFYIEKENATHIAQALGGTDNTYQIPDFQKITSAKFRHFLNAIHTGGESLQQYLV